MCNKFFVVKFLQFRLIRKISTTVDSYNIDEHSYSFWSATRYLENHVSLAVVVNLTLPRGCGLVHVHAYSLTITAKGFFLGVTFSRLVLTVKLF